MENDEILNLKDVGARELLCLDPTNPKLDAVLRVNLDRVRVNIMNSFMKNSHRAGNER